MLIDLNRRAQAEAFGLIIIVGLVFVIFLILTRLEEGRDPTDIATQYETSELSSNTINTLQSTVVRECNDRTFQDIAIECVRDENSLCAGEMTNCEIFLYKTSEILDEVFTRVNLDYLITFSAEGRDLPEILENPIPNHSPCSDNMRGESFPIPLNPGNLVITLVVCSP